MRARAWTRWVVCVQLRRSEVQTPGAWQSIAKSCLGADGQALWCGVEGGLSLHLAWASAWLGSVRRLANEGPRQDYWLRGSAARRWVMVIDDGTQCGIHRYGVRTEGIPRSRFAGFARLGRHCDYTSSARLVKPAPSPGGPGANRMQMQKGRQLFICPNGAAFRWTRQREGGMLEEASHILPCHRG